MPLLATSDIYVSDGGHEDNGGAHDPTYGGDFALANQNDAVAIINGGSVTGTITSGSPTYFTTNASGRGASWQGLALNIITGGVGVTTGRFILSSWDSENDRFIVVGYTGSSGDVTSGRIGGRIKTLGKAGEIQVDGITIWNVGETFMVSGTNNVAGGRITLANSLANRPTCVRGCAATPNDGGYGSVTYTGPDAATYMMTGGTDRWFDRLIIDTGARASLGGISNGLANGFVTRCRFKNHVSASRFALEGRVCFLNAFEGPTTTNAVRLMSANGGGIAMGNTVLCRSTNSAAIPFAVDSAAAVLHNWITCTSSSVRAMDNYQSPLTAHNVCHGGRLVIRGVGRFPRWVFNNVVGGITTAVRAFDFSESHLLPLFMHSNATYGLSGGATAYDTAKATPINQIELPASPFVDAANLDFRLATNDSAQLLKHAGYQEFVRLSDVISGFPDIGAYQAQAISGYPISRIVNATG